MEDWLKKIIDDDDLGLLNVKPKTEAVISNDRLANSFKEINKFIDKNGKEPQISSNILENMLYYRLEGIRTCPQKSSYLKQFDRYKLLNISNEKQMPMSINDIFDDDDLRLLSLNEQQDIFNIRKELQQDTSGRISSYDYIATRKKCKDFDKFEVMFKACQSDLKNKKRILNKFTTETSIVEGNFFVLQGVLLYIDKVGEFKHRNTRQQARLRCVYENGTESNILRNSLAKAMYTDGLIVTENQDKLLTRFANITNEDKHSGYVYVLKSLSKDPQVKNIKDLYKIGYSETAVEDRIRNALNEPTYLMAKVKIVATYEMYNMNTKKFEDLLHRFFKSACVSIDVIDNNGTRCTPREWFQVPFEIIQQAILLLQSGEIVNYKYSRNNKEIDPI